MRAIARILPAPGGGTIVSRPDRKGGGFTVTVSTRDLMRALVRGEEKK